LRTVRTHKALWPCSTDETPLAVGRHDSSSVDTTLALGARCTIRPRNPCHPVCTGHALGTLLPGKARISTNAVGSRIAIDNESI
jgi:hypothetical protein